MDNTNHEEYMNLALKLAEKGCGFVSPNPMVGAVVVKNGRVIGQGYHKKYGGFHAERNALATCITSPHGASLYVTLEPCCHQGKQPPCVEAILEAEIAHVVIGSKDPNPIVSGKGVEILRKNGVKVTENILEEECKKLNEVFFYFIKTKLPYVVMKYAMSMDGKIATYTGASKWITGEEARKHVHQLRHRYSAIMVGVGTVLKDDPQLTCRIDQGRNPIRIICDTNLRTPISAKVIETARNVQTIIATCCNDVKKQAPYKEKGCEILVLPKSDGHVDLPSLMAQLGGEGIDSVLLEGGSTLNWAAVKSGIVNKIQAYISPKLICGERAKSPIGGIGFPDCKDAVQLKNSKVLQLGEDFLIESEVVGNVYWNC